MTGLRILQTSRRDFDLSPDGCIPDRSSNDQRLPVVSLAIVIYRTWRRRLFLAIRWFRGHPASGTNEFSIVVVSVCLVCLWAERETARSPARNRLNDSAFWLRRPSCRILFPYSARRFFLRPSSADRRVRSVRVSFARSRAAPHVALAIFPRWRPLPDSSAHKPARSDTPIRRGAARSQGELSTNGCSDSGRLLNGIEGNTAAGLSLVHTRTDESPRARREVATGAKICGIVETHLPDGIEPLNHFGKPLTRSVLEHLCPDAIARKSTAPPVSVNHGR